MANRGFDHKQIEQKWQTYWADQKVFEVDETKKDKFYLLDMFAYPSGEGLHVGHPRGYTASDILAKYYMLKGKNVLHPFGWDAFGLPAENYAVKVGVHPKENTAKNIVNFKRQLTSFGFGYDWSREINTSEPNYYKWTQWLFKVLYENGYAYQKETLVNWDPVDKTVLANEQVLPDGTAERSGAKVEQKKMTQWFFRITDFADELIQGLDNLDWPVSTKEMQKNWIGRSVGAEIKFQIVRHPELASGSDEPMARRDSGSKNKMPKQVRHDGLEIKVFTTRPDTIFGVTFLVVSPELAKEWIEGGWKADSKTLDYISASFAKTQRTRLAGAGDKTGVDTGLTVTNPATGEAIPIWVADYVLGDYGTGAIMAVPAHDERDLEFARAHKLPVQEVIEPLTIVTTGEDAVKPELEFTHRDAVVCIVKHWSEDKYLCQQWKKIDWRGFVVGGIEAGEDVAEAGRREVVEETGYQNPKFVRQLGGMVHAQFYHNVKNVNRWAHFRGLLFELENDEFRELTAEEEALHEIKWVSRAEVEQFITAQDMKIFWSRVQDKYFWSDKGVLANSGEFDGQTSDGAWDKIIHKVGGIKQTTFKLRDWSVSRQRYWGAPIPVVYRPTGESKQSHQSAPISPIKNGERWEVVSVDEKDLPVLLPDDVDFKPTGEPPLARSQVFNEGVEAKYGVGAYREVETMDTFVCSSWYFLRYCDPHNTKEFAGKKTLAYWMPVDLYIGGAEHTNGHLLYARFITKALHKLGYLKFDEPFLKLRHQGFILGENGEKMSKSRGNVVNPDEVVERFGADTLRMYEMFLGPFNMSMPWSTQGVVGIRRFLDKVWLKVQGASAKNTSTPHQLVAKVTQDLESEKFNTAISSMMEFLNGADADGTWVRSFVQLLAPFAPHLAEEIWQNILGEKKSIFESSWPTFDVKALAQETVNIAVQEAGKLRGIVSVAVGTSEADVLQVVAKDDKLKQLTQNYAEHIFVPDKVINFIK